MPGSGRMALTAAATVAAAVWVGGAVLASGAPLGEGRVPNVYGEGILFAFSGIDGPTSWATPVVASTTRLPGLAFHLPRDPKVLVRMTSVEAESLRWRIVTNDLMAADFQGEPYALVIGFASRNLVVGRVPRGTRIAQEGGGPECALLRKTDGDRTQFAFAYDAGSGVRAADTASGGLSTSLESLIENRLDFYKNLPGLPHGTDPRVVNAFAKAFSVMRANTYTREGPILTRWTTPDRWPDRDIYLRASAFQGLGLMHLDAVLAEEALLAVCTFQDKSGFIPGRMSPGGCSDISQPPLLGWASSQVYPNDRRKEQKVLQTLYEAADRHVTWLLANRRIGDGWLFAWKSGEESGAANSPRFDGGADFAAIDLASYLAHECRVLQDMAQQLRYREIARKWDRTATAIEEAAREHLWHEDRGFFFDRKGPGGEWVDMWTSAGLLPLWAGIATKEQAAQMIRHLKEKDKFWTALPVPSVAHDDPKFAKDMGRGPTWVTTNYLIIRGLQRYGYKAEAESLRARTIEAVADWYGRTGVLYEFYDCDNQTPPAELDRKGHQSRDSAQAVIGDYNPTAALYVDLLLRP